MCNLIHAPNMKEAPHMLFCVTLRIHTASKNKKKINKCLSKELRDHSADRKDEDNSRKDCKNTAPCV